VATRQEKCAVLGELWLNYREEANTNEYWAQFFRVNDISLPAAYLIDAGYVEITSDSDLDEFINETWEMFCEFISIDPDRHYDDLYDAWDSSPNPPLGETQMTSSPTTGGASLTKASAGLGVGDSSHAGGSGTSQARFCRSCGAPRVPDSRFCTQCGSSE